MFYIYLYIQIYNIMEKVMNNSKLTSVKILEDLYKRFKATTVNTKMTLQKLTNRSIDLYLTDKQYKQQLETHDNLTISGSNL